MIWHSWQTGLLSMWLWVWSLKVRMEEHILGEVGPLNNYVPRRISLKLPGEGNISKCSYYCINKGVTPCALWCVNLTWGLWMAYWTIWKVSVEFKRTKHNWSGIGLVKEYRTYFWSTFNLYSTRNREIEIWNQNLAYIHCAFKLFHFDPPNWQLSPLHKFLHANENVAYMLIVKG